MPLDDLFTFFSTYDDASYFAIASMDDAPHEEDVAEFEESVGFRLPDEVRALMMSPLGGLCLEVREELRPAAAEESDDASSAARYGVKAFGISEEIPDWLDIRVEYDRFVAEGGDERLVPVFQVQGEDDLYCCTPKQALVRWHHGTGATTPVAATFTEVVMEEIRALEERKDRMLRGGNDAGA